MQKRYPKPKAVGGKLIRQVIAFLKEQGLTLPIDSQILCALSGGSDSLALAHLLLKYGRRIIAPEQVILVHVNHGWRGKESDADELAVQDFAREYDANIEVIRLEKPGKAAAGKSLEDLARRDRYEIFQKLAELHECRFVFTAHQAEDLAETLLWRLLTGAAQTQGAGIWAQEGLLLRPFLSTRKDTLKSYLKEEKISWREDSTNRDPRFQRTRIRESIFPQIEMVFPQAVQHLVQLGLAAQRGAKEKETEGYDLGSVFFKIVSGRVRRAHWEALEPLKGRKQGELHLPNGWILKKEGKTRWVLEQNSV